MVTRTPLAQDRLRAHPIVTAVRLLLQDVLALIASPIHFFRMVARERSLYSPLLVGLLSIQLSVIVGGLLILAGIEGIQGAAYVVLYWAGIATGQHMVGLELTGAGLIGAIVLAPVLAALLLLGSTVFIHSLVVLAVGDSNTGFRNTFRAVCCASVVNLVNWVPVVGLPLNLIGLALVTVGIRELHRTKSWRASVVGLTPLVTFLVFFMLLQVLPE